AEFVQKLTGINQKESEAREKRIDSAMRLNVIENTVSPLASAQEQAAAHRRQLDADRAAVESERAGVEQKFDQAAKIAEREGQDSPNFQQAVRERAQYEERVFDLKQRELQLVQQERQVSIDAARQKLQFLADQLEKQKQLAREASATAQAAKKKEEDVTISLGQLTEGQVHRLGDIKKRLQRGEHLSRKQTEFAEQHGDLEMKELLRLHDAQLGRKRREQLAAGGVEFGNRERENKEAAQAEMDERAREEMRQQRGLRQGIDQANAANDGTRFRVNVNNQVEAKVVADSEIEAKVKAAVMAAAREHLKSEEAKIRGWIQEAFEQATQEQKRTIQRRNQAVAAAMGA
ncbi:MAG TPA: hypothetical protein VG125_13945, partial [Pirellulales bacterium]|nr:hypothetical protein [Pirellulales bacterium]